MFIALYHWSVKDGSEQDFQDCWRVLTEEIYRDCGSLGSRLHRAEDGTWFAYAQWPDRAAYDAARNIPDTDEAARARFRDSIAESFPVTFMQVTDDLLQPRSATD